MYPSITAALSQPACGSSGRSVRGTMVRSSSLGTWCIVVNSGSTAHRCIIGRYSAVAWRSQRSPSSHSAAGRIHRGGRGGTTRSYGSGGSSRSGQLAACRPNRQKNAPLVIQKSRKPASEWGGSALATVPRRTSSAGGP